MVIDYDGTNTGEALRRLSLVSDRGVVFLVPGTIRGLREGTATVEAESITRKCEAGGRASLQQS